MAIENGAVDHAGLGLGQSRPHPELEGTDRLDRRDRLPALVQKRGGWLLRGGDTHADLFWWTGDSEQDPWSGTASSPAAERWPTGSSLVGRQGSSPRPGSLTSPTGGGTAMTLTAAGTRNWPPCARSGSWTALWGRMRWFSFALKRQAGFGKEGEKNFEGTITDLQMSGYLLIPGLPAADQQEGAPLRLAHTLSTPRRRPCGATITLPRPIPWNRRSPRL